MRGKIKSFQSLYHQVNDGDPWHGPSLKNILNRINPESVERESPNVGKSIAALLMHILAWRNFVLLKVKDEASDIVLNSEEDWPLPVMAIDDLIKDLDQCFLDLHAVLEMKDDTWFGEAVKGKGYTNSEMLYGLIHHDVHHFSQILFIDNEINR